MRPSSVFSVLHVMILLLTHSAFLPGSTSAQSLDQAFEIVDRAVKDGSIPGASVLIMQHGKVVEQKSFGVCEIENGRPFRSDTICWIASLTKPITASAAMKLVRDGKLQLDEMITHHFPFTEYGRAYETIEAAKGEIMKVMITLD